MLFRHTLVHHIGLLHFNEIPWVGYVKRNLAAPIEVRENLREQSEQAIYRVDGGPHPYIQVNVKYGRWVQEIAKKVNLVATYYWTPDFPKGRRLWP